LFIPDEIPVSIRFHYTLFIMSVRKVRSLEKNDAKLNKTLLNWLLCIEDRPLQEDCLIDDYVMVDERCHGQLFHQHCHQHRSDNKNLNNSNMQCGLNIL
ncbi:hypothetical protein, partial [Piscirickettsia salmonis]